MCQRTNFIELKVSATSHEDADSYHQSEQRGKLARSYDDAPSQDQLKTPVVEVRRSDSRQLLTTILTHHAFVLQERAIEFGFVLGREWVDKRLAEI